MNKRDLEPEDAKMVKAITVAVRAFGEALFETIRLGVKAASNEKQKAPYRENNRKMWEHAAEKLIDVMMEP